VNWPGAIITPCWTVRATTQTSILAALKSYAGRYAFPASLLESGAGQCRTISKPHGRMAGCITILPGDVTMPMPLYPTLPTTFIAASYDAYAPLFKVEIMFDAGWAGERNTGRFW